MKKTGWLSGWKEIAKHCGWCVTTTKAWHKKKKLPVKKIGGQYKVSPAELDKWLMDLPEK